MGNPGIYATRMVAFLALVACFLVEVRAEAQVGFGTHPLEEAIKGRSRFGLTFTLTGQDSSDTRKHLQVLPRSLFLMEDSGARNGYGLHDSLALDYYSRGQFSLEDALKRLVRDHVGSLMGIRTEKSEENGSVLLSFHFGGVKLCSFGVRGAAIFDREILLQGQTPLVSDWPSPISTDDWPDRDHALSQATDTLERMMGGPIEAKSVSSRCYTAFQGTLKPAWHLSFAVRGYPYSVYADEDQIFAVEPAFFHATGRARSYPYDPVSTPNLTTEVLSDLKGDGTLTNEYFRTVVSLGQRRAYSPNSEFLFDVTTPEFKETSVFVNATKHLKFLQGLGFTWYGPRPLLLNPLCTTPVCRPNNAMFSSPETATDLPAITIGLEQKVDGKDILRNLATDAGVVSHELGHFVVFRTLTTTDGESLVLHEALADYLEAARAGDPCLAESICPEDSPVCMQKGMCLRTADNEFKFNDYDWQAFFKSTGEYNHRHSQLFSGLLWDLRNKAKGGAKGIDTLVMRTIGFLPPEAGFSDFLVQLVVTDKDINQGLHFDQIVELVKKRNLDSFLKLDESGNPIVTVAKKGGQTDGDSPGVAGETPDRTKKSKGCAVVGEQKGGDGRTRPRYGDFWMILLPISTVFALKVLNYFNIYLHFYRYFIK